MARHISPNNQISVPVLDCEGNPVAPTRPSRARTLIESGRARKHWLHGRFAIQLIQPNEEPMATPALALGIDPGTTITGLTVTAVNKDGETQMVHGAEVHHRTQRISGSMQSRKSYRTGRRHRLRHRPARFHNRKTAPDWLPPSLKSNLDSIHANVKHIMDLFPITGITIETCKFDPRLMTDPEVYGAGYQESERGSLQLREYVLQRDGRTCQYCQTKNGRMELDHVMPRSRKGSNSPKNLVTACRPCNKSKGNQTLKDFLRNNPKTLAKVQAKLKQTPKSAAHMNRLMPLILQKLRHPGLPIAETDAVETSLTRRTLGIPKSHVNDAACTTAPQSIPLLPASTLQIKGAGRGKRQMLTPPSKYGTPRYKEGKEGQDSPYRVYSRLPRDIQGFTKTPGHKQKARRVNGITSGDLIRYHHPKHGAVTGYAVFTKRNTRVGVTGQGTVKTEAAQLIARSNGYRYSTQRLKANPESKVPPAQNQKVNLKHFRAKPCRKKTGSPVPAVKDLTPRSRARPAHYATVTGRSPLRWRRSTSANTPTSAASAVHTRQHCRDERAQMMHRSSLIEHVERRAVTVYAVLIVTVIAVLLTLNWTGVIPVPNTTLPTDASSPADAAAASQPKPRHLLIASQDDIRDGTAHATIEQPRNLRPRLQPRVVCRMHPTLGINVQEQGLVTRRG